MNKTQSINTTSLFSVRAKSHAKTEFTWNFVQQGDSIVFAGKTLLQKRSLAENRPIQKPQFIIEANNSFPLYEYTYLPENLISTAFVEVFNCSIRPKTKIFAWFSHIAPLLLAIENGDSLLAAEIFNKNTHIFMQYPTTTIKLLEPIAVEVLFSWVWGRFDDDSKKDLQTIYEGKCSKPFSEWGVAEAFFTSARRRLNILSGSESLDNCMARYLKEHPGTKLTLGIVGSTHYRWVEKSLHAKEALSNRTFSKTKSIVQADLTNNYDKNAIALYLHEDEKQESKKEISGYIRKTGAELLRKAFPTKLEFSSKLARLGYVKGGTTGIVVEITV